MILKIFKINTDVGTKNVEAEIEDVIEKANAAEESKLTDDVSPMKDHDGKLDQFKSQ